MRVHLAVLAVCTALTAAGELVAQGGAPGAIAWADLGPLQPRLEARGLTADAFPAYVQRVRETHAVRVRTAISITLSSTCSSRRTSARFRRSNRP